MRGLKLLLALLLIWLTVLPMNASASSEELCDWTGLIGHDTSGNPKNGEVNCGANGITFSGETKYYVDGSGGGATGGIFNRPVHPLDISVELTIDELADTAVEDAWVSVSFLDDKKFFNIFNNLDPSGVVSLFRNDGGLLTTQVDGYASFSSSETHKTFLNKSTGIELGDPFTVRLNRDIVGKWHYSVNGVRLDELDAMKDLPAGLYDGSDVHVVVGMHNVNGNETTLTVHHVLSGGHYATESEDIKIFNERIFAEPPLQYRPLRIIHEDLTTGIVDDLKSLGYGGVVTNVDYYSSYLESAVKWNELVDLIEYTIDEAELRVWLYDEKGYPSGTAGGIVLRERPDLEAQGLAAIIRETSGNENITILHPAGHEDVVLVAAFAGTKDNYDIDTAVDLQAFLDASGNLSWSAPVGDWVVFYMVQKPFYEGTHAANNWFEQRRYVNLIEEDAAATFIEWTHEQYYDYLSNYFGNGIEAFFTDEPALTGTYFDPPPRTPLVYDTPDPNVPLLPSVNWGNQLFDQFESLRGYDLEPYLPYLASGDSNLAKQIRWDFYKTLSELFEDHYLGQLESFCEDTGIACTGHLLLEEDLYHQAVLSGNLISLLGRMHYPGIDMLTAYPWIAKIAPRNKS